MPSTHCAQSRRFGLNTATALALGGFALASLALATASPAGAACVTKAGSATGITRGFAEYEAFLIIRQVTGNWPFQQDRISEPVYACAQDGIMWTCKATAEVCKS